MRQAHGAAQVVVSVNFTAEQQTVNLASGGRGHRTHHVKTLLKSPGAVEPESL